MAKLSKSLCEQLKPVFLYKFSKKKEKVMTSYYIFNAWEFKQLL